ncbi:MAG: ribbon-helix-helix protein, CopG family [Acidimicrobiia bacterium]|nr:ribbon-helix-helix protein, CopG family [Acidimicrobiia bacterium]
MRTTIRIDDDLYRRAKARAVEQGRSVGELIEDAVRMALRPPRTSSADLPDLPVFGGSGTLPGVDLADARSLRDLMDDDDDVDALR